MPDDTVASEAGGSDIDTTFESDDSSDDAYGSGTELFETHSPTAVIDSGDFEAIDSHGDLYLQVDSNQFVYFRVQSERLRGFSSKSMRRLLDSGDQPIDKYWVIHLLSDHDAWRVLLHILHGNIARIPLRARS